MVVLWGVGNCRIQLGVKLFRHLLGPSTAVGGNVVGCCSGPLPIFTDGSFEVPLSRLGTFGTWLSMSGFSSSRLIQVVIDENIASVPIVAMSAQSRDEVQDWGLDAGLVQEVWY